LREPYLFGHDDDVHCRSGKSAKPSTVDRLVGLGHPWWLQVEIDPFKFDVMSNNAKLI
jgi:hypothetical protein